MTQKRTDSVTFYTEGVRAGNRRVLSKAITLIESSRSDHRKTAQDVMDRLLPHTGQAIRLGITGVPGVGKSTFVESLGMHLVGQGLRLAILAVDPSSRRSGGSILADKTRMERLSTEPNAFIRPSPSGGALGGVARKTKETMLLCEAAGFDVILVETVGVGQSETTVASMVDFFLVLMLAGAGDELQGIKKGIMELADAVVINKADGDNVRPAAKARKAYENALHLLRPVTESWTPPVLTCSALAHKDVDKVWEVVVAHNNALTASGELAAKRREQSLEWMWALIGDGLQERFNNHPLIRRRLPKTLKAVASGETTPTKAAGDLLFFLDNGL